MIDRWAHTQIYDKMMLDDTGHYVKHADHLTEVTALQEEVDKLKDIQVLLGECARYISDEIYYSNSAKAHVGSKHRHRLQILKQIELSTEPKEKDDG